MDMGHFVCCLGILSVVAFVLILLRPYISFDNQEQILGDRLGCFTTPVMMTRYCTISLSIVLLPSNIFMKKLLSDATL